MRVIAIVKLLIAIGIIVLLFKFEAWAAVTPPRVPATLMSSLTVGKEAEHEFIKPGDRIVGGRLAVRGEFPYQVSIQRISILGTRTHYCGGALVGQCVVTAAHCLEGRNAKDLSVRIGSTTLKSDQFAQDIRVNKIILHPAYDPKIIINDIGILKLNRRVKVTPGVKAVPVPDHEEEVEPDTHCIVSGWGSQYEGGTVSKELMYATVPTMSDRKCKEFYGKAEIFDSMLCAGYSEGGVDSCQGDSGGPLVCDGKFVGIVSWGIGCARPRFPGVYTQVAYFTKWISSMDCFKEFNETETSVSSDSNPAKFFNFPFFSFWKDE